MSEDLPPTQSVHSDSTPPERLGKYRILQKIGEGGMGEVYLAEQVEPVRRRVALKIIKRGLETDRVIARFEAERQALAMLNHPNVAKVFDAGSTPHGRPYFAMEYVEGVPVTEFCDRHRLTMKERMQLLMQVCEGVQHAHQNAIIHRDIKPSNVLVTTQDGKRIPKIIDFGVAKATAQRLTERTVFTELGQLIGTPEYMSPEQAEMTAEAVDTRTDVYSLGVLLYELLVGALPFDPRELRRAGFDEIRRKIREEEPSKPSTRISTLGDVAAGVARNRRADPASLARQLRGDLDWITMKALEKDRTRRYSSPSELAEDVRRHLQHQPVIAGPPSTLYRVQKFGRRHRFGVGTAAAGLLVLVAFAGTMAVQAERIARERDRATLEAQTSKRVSEFLTGLFKVSDPNEARGNSITARDLLNSGAKKIEDELEDQPELQARLIHTMGIVYRELGLYSEAEPLLERALATRRSTLGDDHPDTLSSQFELAFLYGAAGRQDEAYRLGLEALEGQRRVLGDDHRDTLQSMMRLALGYVFGGRYDEGEPLLLEVLERQRRVLGEDDPNTLKSKYGLAGLLANTDRYDEAEPAFLEGLEGQRRMLGNDHPDTLDSMWALAQLYSATGRQDEAEPLFLEAIDGQRRVLGDDHPGTLRSMGALAGQYIRATRYNEAEGLLREVLERQRDGLGDDHPETLWSTNGLAALYSQTGRYEEAEPLYLQAHEGLKREVGDDNPYTIGCGINLANLYVKTGRYAAAEPLYLKALDERAHLLPNKNRTFNTLPAMANLVELYVNQGRYEKARPLCAEFLRLVRKRVEGESKDADARKSYAWLALLCEPTDLWDPESALRFAIEANELTDYGDPDYLDTLALAYHRTGDTAKAVEIQRRALSLLSADDARNRADLEKRLSEFEAALD